MNFSLQNWCDSPNKFHMQISLLLYEIFHQNSLKGGPESQLKSQLPNPGYLILATRNHVVTYVGNNCLI